MPRKCGSFFLGHQLQKERAWTEKEQINCDLIPAKRLLSCGVSCLSSISESNMLPGLGLQKISMAAVGDDQCPYERSSNQAGKTHRPVDPSCGTGHRSVYRRGLLGCLGSSHFGAGSAPRPRKPEVDQTEARAKTCERGSCVLGSQSPPVRRSGENGA